MRYLVKMMLVLSLGAPVAAMEEQKDEATITTWKVPWENTRPRDPDLGGDGRVWFVGQRGHYLAWLDTESGEFERIDLPDGTGPHNLIIPTVFPITPAAPPARCNPGPAA